MSNIIKHTRPIIIGGKIYGEGKKGKLIDIIGIDNDVFEKNKENIKYISNEFTSLENVETETDVSFEINNYLVKIFTDETDMMREYKVTLQLINIGISDDYVSKNDKKFSIIQNSKGQYGLLKSKCSNTLDKFTVIFLKRGVNFVIDEKYNLQNVVKTLLYQFIKLQNNNISHCDIKADNIMFCKSGAQLIDWDKTIFTSEYLTDFCAETKDYFGSSTHTTPLMLDMLNKYCPQKIKLIKSLEKKLLTSVALFVKYRHVSSKSVQIENMTKKYFEDNLQNFIKYHIDLYAFSLCFYEIVSNPEHIVQLLPMIILLQNIIYIDGTTIHYINEGKQKTISVDDFVKTHIINNYYLVKNTALLDNFLFLVDEINKYDDILRENKDNNLIILQHKQLLKTYETYTEYSEQIVYDTSNIHSIYNINDNLITKLKECNEKYLKYKERYLKYKNVSHQIKE